MEKWTLNSAHISASFCDFPSIQPNMQSLTFYLHIKHVDCSMCKSLSLWLSWVVNFSAIITTGLLNLLVSARPTFPSWSMKVMLCGRHLISFNYIIMFRMFSDSTILDSRTKCQYCQNIFYWSLLGICVEGHPSVPLNLIHWLILSKQIRFIKTCLFLKLLVLVNFMILLSKILGIVIFQNY